MSGFTKGPWSVGNKTGTLIFTGPDGGTGDFICEVSGEDDTPREVNKANARLIAASPTMYESLVKAESHLAAIGTPRDSMGRYNKDGEWTFNEALPRNVDAAEVSAAFAVIRAALSKAAGEGV